MHLENLDLNLLVVIDALLRRRSVTAAADELHITQSAMSSALKRARRHFGDELFYYDGQSMTPTAFGATLEQRIPDMVARLRALSRMRPANDLAALQRHFTIVASDYVAAVYISALSRTLAHVAPQVSLTIVPYTHEAIRQFQRGVLDFLVGPNFALERSYTAEPLFADRFKCVLWANNPLLANGFTAEAFYQSPMVVTNFFLDDGKSHFERWLHEQGRSIRVAASLPSFLVLPHYIAGTANIATIHQRLVPNFAGFADLAFVDPPVDVPPLQEYLVTTEKHQHDSDAQMLAKVMRRVGQQI
jgi:LysR family nod box-dependent transcriptional activator